jgi:hypothetical protein
VQQPLFFHEGVQTSGSKCGKPWCLSQSVMFAGKCPTILFLSSRKWTRHCIPIVHVVLDLLKAGSWTTDMTIDKAIWMLHADEVRTTSAFWWILQLCELAVVEKGWLDWLMGCFLHLYDGTWRGMVCLAFCLNERTITIW